MSQVLDKLQPLVATLRKSNPFYAARLGSAPIHSLDDFRREVPFTFKREIVADHGGTVRFRNHPEGGFEVRLALPTG